MFIDYKFLRNMEYQLQRSMLMLIQQCQLLFYPGIQYQSAVLCTRTNEVIKRKLLLWLIVESKILL